MEKRSDEWESNDLKELREQTRIARRKLNEEREDFSRYLKAHKKQIKVLDKSPHAGSYDLQDQMLDRNRAAFEILFKNMKDMEERMTIELNRLRNS